MEVADLRHQEWLSFAEDSTEQHSGPARNGPPWGSRRRPCAEREEQRRERLGILVRRHDHAADGLRWSAFEVEGLGLRFRQRLARE
jgi:hypothetical protein